MNRNVIVFKCKSRKYIRLVLIFLVVQSSPLVPIETLNCADPLLHSGDDNTSVNQ